MKRVMFAIVAMLVMISVGTFIPEANAWILTHTYTESGDQQDVFYASYTGNYKVRAKAPTIGYLRAQVKENGGQVYIIRADINVHDGDVECETVYLSTGYSNQLFATLATVTSGTGEAQIWDIYQTKIPICPSGQND